MRFYWIYDCICQGQFTVEWKRGKENLDDYFTKHHPKKRHARIRSMYFDDPGNPKRNYFELLSKNQEETTM
jgi:hypothetical protein